MTDGLFVPSVTPASLIFKTQTGKLLSEYVPFKGVIKASFVCTSAACDGHLSGLLPSDIPPAPKDTVYTKRFFVSEDSVSQRYIHLTTPQFIDYFVDAVKESFDRFDSKNILLMGGFSTQGIALAVCSRTFLPTASLTYLVTSDLFRSSEKRALLSFLKSNNIAVAEVKGKPTLLERESLSQFVSDAVMKIRGDYDVVLEPVSSTVIMAAQLAAVRGVSIQNMPDTRLTLTGVTSKEIDLFVQIVSSPELYDFIRNVSERQGKKFLPAWYDVFMMGASALEYYIPSL